MDPTLHPELRDWLMQGDPAVRWRVLTMQGADANTIRGERALVGVQGWGGRLLAEQSPDGRWGGGDYSPKWVSTTYTLLHLMWLGLPAQHPAALRGLETLWEWRDRWEPETCIVSMLTRLTATFGYEGGHPEQLVADLLEQQNNDGGWNCRSRVDRTRHSSFHTSIQALEALRAFQVNGGQIDTFAAQARGREFFLNHRLYKSHHNGQVAIAASTRFPAFPEWHFDVLRGLEHFATLDTPADERLVDAVDLLASKRRRDGRWSTYSPYPGRQWFRLEAPGRSRWTTVRALAVLRWWAGQPVGR